MDDKLKEVFKIFDKFYDSSGYICKQDFSFLNVYNSDLFELKARFSIGFEYNIWVRGKSNYILEDNLYFQIYQLSKFIEYVKSNFGLYFQKEYNFKDYTKLINFQYSSYNGEMHITIPEFNIIIKYSSNDQNSLSAGYRILNHNTKVLYTSTLEDTIMLCYFLIDILKLMLNYKDLNLTQIKNKLTDISKTWI